MQVMLLQMMFYFSFSGCFAQLENLNSLNREKNDPLNYIHLTKTEDRSLTGHVIETFLVLNDVECAFKCLFNPTCSSFNYGESKTNGFFVCELNNASHFSNPQNMTNKEGFVYAGIKVTSALVTLLIRHICSKRVENWVRVGTAIHPWIDRIDSRFIDNMTESFVL